MSQGPRPDSTLEPGRSRLESSAADRAMTGLPALLAALLLLTAVTGIALAMAEGGLVSADRDAAERRLAVSLAERLVAADSPLTVRANVLNGTRVDRLDGAGLKASVPAVRDNGVRLSVNGSTVAHTGGSAGGTTFRRLVVVQRTQRRTVQPALGSARVATLPRRTSHVRLELVPPPSTTVTAVLANDRVVLRNRSGLAGTFDLRLSRFATTRLRFVGSGSLPRGSVTLGFDAARTRKAVLEVTVDG